MAGKTQEVIAQEWLESERGWGQRPDGYTLHLTMEDCKKYRDEYWSKQPDDVPECYSRECGDPFSVAVAPKLFKLVKEKSKEGRCVRVDSLSDLKAK